MTRAGRSIRPWITADMTTNTPKTARWARCSATYYFHVVDSDRPYNVVTLCRGAQAVNVEDEFVEWSASPPENERCPSCQRIVIDPIERGLAELVNNAHEDITAKFDLGGES